VIAPAYDDQDTQELVCQHIASFIRAQTCRLRDARQLRLPSAEQQRRFEAVDLAALEAEVAEVEAVCNAVGSPVVCSHNDLLSGNIMVPLEVSACVSTSLAQCCRVDMFCTAPLSPGFWRCAEDQKPALSTRILRIAADGPEQRSRAAADREHSVHRLRVQLPHAARLRLGAPMLVSSHWCNFKFQPCTH